MAEQTSRLAIILDSTGAKRSADTLATSLERLTTQGEKATGSTDELGFSFKRLATSAAGALSIGIVIKTVDEWGQVAARMKNALRSVEGDIKNYSMLQERFLEISNRNGKNIADTQLLYIGAASSMQELGYSTAQTVDYIESLSSAMTANASSVNEVLSMQNALNKAQIAGKVAGENWNSIMNATPTLLGDIAKQLEKQNGGIKVTEMEVKKLAADGKISFKLFADAVMAAKDANNALADSMDNTVADGLTRVTNSAKAYYGELNQSLGITRAISASLATVSDNFGSVSTVLTGIVGIGAARYFGNLSNSIYDSTKKTAENALTNRKLAVDKVNAAEDAGETKPENIKVLEDAAAELYNLNKENKELTKTTKQSRDAGQEMLKQLREQALAIEDQLRYSGKLTDAGFQRLSFERQIAAIKAKGNKATDDEKSLLATQSQVLAAYKELEVRQETAKLMEEYRSQQTSIYSEMQKGNTVLVERLTLLDKLKAAGKLTDSEYNSSRDNAIKNTKPTLPQSVTSVTGNLLPTGGELSGTWGGMQQQMNELQKAQEAVSQWQEQQLESYRQYYEGKANLTAEYEARIAETQKTARQANDQIEAQRREINRAATESIMDSIVSITRDGFGEQSAVYKAAFVANKAFAIAQSMLSIQQGIAMAAANPFPMNLAAMASVAAQTASIVSNIQGVAGVGFSKGGYTGGGNKYDPRGIVHAGEFVFTKEATDKIGKENLYRLMNTGTLPMDALKADQYAMKNINPANQTTNNSSEENSTKVITIHAAPITIQGNPDDKTIALIEQSQKKAIMDCYKAISNDLAEGKGNVSKALGTGWNTKRKTG